jgi:VIT1/CCC1 family predicted Fe2+/Mn2+ transporter
MAELSPSIRAALRAAQRNEISEYHIYSRLARSTRHPGNRAVLEQIAQDERRHYDYWKELTDEEVQPSRLRVWLFVWIARVLGLSFGIKLMERLEDRAQDSYRSLAAAVPKADDVADDEEEHERKLIETIDEERLRYVGAVVRGLNDALVELSGALAGFTFALAKPRVIAMVGLITGLAASMSMAASEYLGRKAEPGDLHPGKAAASTGLAYVGTVFLLVLPYLLFANVYVSLAVMIGIALLIIALFFYVSVAQTLPFWKRLAEMAGISLGVAALSFAIGALIRTVFGVEV